MNVSYINPFFESAYTVLANVLGVGVRRGDLSLKRMPTNSLGVTAILGITGHLQGHVLLDMPLMTAINVANIMIEKMAMDKITVLNDLGRSAITELVNLIGGQAVTELSNLGSSFDLTPPALFVGKDLDFTINSDEVLLMPLEMPIGKIEVNVALSERPQLA